MAKGRNSIYMMGLGDKHSHGITTTGTSDIIPANINRQMLIIQNISAVRVSMNLGATAEKNKGIVLEPAVGGRISSTSSYELSARRGNLFLGIIKGIADSGTATVRVIEGL
jgi:hypothetical protein